MKTCKFITYGCKVNQYETQLMREQVISCGYKEPGAGKKAGLYIVNSCTVTERADSDSLDSIRKIYRQNPQAAIIFTGCLAQKDAGRIRAMGKDVLIVKNSNKDDIREFLPALGNQGAGFTRSQKGISFFQGHTRAFLKVQDGCNNRCSYCKVSLVRGTSRSKPLEEAVAEAKNLVASGIKEIVLCGICLGSYGKDLSQKQSLCSLIRALERIKGLLRIRLSSIEAKDVTDELIELLSVGKKVCPHLHIPIQSGDDRLLRLMNRSYTAKEYAGLVKRIRAAVPEVMVTTDVMVGFPGETASAFRNTLELIRKVLPLRTHVFPYSPRPGTKSAAFLDSVTRQEKKSRSLLLRSLAQECARKCQDSFVGKKLEVLFEQRKSPGSRIWSGYAGNYLRIEAVSGKSLRNALLPVKVIGLGGQFLKAKLILE